MTSLEGCRFGAANGSVVKDDLDALLFSASSREGWAVSPVTQL
jgi:hypothetical protein